MSSTGISVIRIAEDYPTGGVPTYGLQPNFVYLSREQARMGLDVSVVARRHRGQPRQEEVGGVNVLRVDSPYNLNALGVVRRLREEKRAAVLHTHSTLGVAIVAFRRSLGLPVFAHVHGTSRSAFMPVKFDFQGLTQDFSSSKLWYYYFRERFLWSRADGVLAVSRSVKSDLSSYYHIPASRISVVYNGVDSSLFKPARFPSIPSLAVFQDRPIILYVGHFGPRKGIDQLIRAMEDVKKEVPEAALVCIGGVPSWLPKANYWARLKELVRASGMEESVALLDKVPNSELPLYYSRASVFVLPSYYEAFAKVVVEAMACATPVVTPIEGGPAEAIADGENGLLYHYGKRSELARAIVSLLQDPPLARRMGINARDAVERNFTWARVAERVLAAYEARLGPNLSSSKQDRVRPVEAAAS